MRADVGITGPIYALVSNKVTYKIESLVLPTDVPPENIVSIKWYRDNIHMPQYPGESEWTFILWDVDYPAAGDYHCVVTIRLLDGTLTYAVSNKIHLEIGTEPREIDMTIRSRTNVKLAHDETLILSPTVSCVPTTVDLSFDWTHNGQDFGHSNTLRIIDAKETDFGLYTFKATAIEETGYNPVSQTIEIYVEEIEDEDDTCLKYIHDLRPTRDIGFIWMGYWVIDEILKAKAEGFDW